MKEIPELYVPDEWRVPRVYRDIPCNDINTMAVQQEVLTFSIGVLDINFVCIDLTFLIIS